MKIKVVITLLFSLMFLSACGGGGGGDTPTSTVSELEGTTWLRSLACEAEGDGTYFQILYSFSGYAVTVHKNVYSDPVCSIDVSNLKAPYGTFSIGNSVTTNSTVSATEITLISDSGTLFDIYSLRNDKLYFGDKSSDINYDGSTADKRPIEISKTDFFISDKGVNITSELDGTWVSVCTYVNDGDYIVTRSINGNIATSTFALYSDSTCNTLVASKQI